MTGANFDEFIGIDWSGAKGRRLKGIQIARAVPGDAAPELIPPPERKWWDRQTVYNWLAERMRRKWVLVGFDFAFGFAHEDEGCYFPGLNHQPDHARALWKQVEEVCAETPDQTPDLFGGTFYLRTDLPYREYFLSHKGRGELYCERHRRVETVCRTVTNPTPVMRCIGAANVGTGSLAGMRLLHRFAEEGAAVIWPFEEVSPDHSAIVEIFPRLYFKRAKVDPKGWRDPAIVNRALAHFSSAPMPPDWQPGREDEPDALVSAAALRSLADQPRMWAAPRSAGDVWHTEGWIFGVDWGSQTP